MRRKEATMKILEMRPYDKARDEPRTGWDAFSVENALQAGKQLYVDQYGDIWTAGQREYIGKVRKEMVV